jgi:hypothetical protein
MGILCKGQSDAEPIEISPAPDIYLVEFILGRQPQRRISIILPATCGLAAMTGAWSLFPEYKRDAKRTSVHAVKYVELDWLSGRTIIVKQKPQRHIPLYKIKNRQSSGKKKKEDVPLAVESWQRRLG